jgi:hypothetical protein
MNWSVLVSDVPVTVTRSPGRTESSAPLSSRLASTSSRRPSDVCSVSPDRPSASTVPSTVWRLGSEAEGATSEGEVEGEDVDAPPVMSPGSSQTATISCRGPCS